MFEIEKQSKQRQGLDSRGGGELRPLKRTLPHRRRKKNKISRFRMSKCQDRVAGEVKRERRVSFTAWGGILKIELMVSSLYTSRHLSTQTLISPPRLEHIVVLNFSVA